MNTLFKDFDWKNGTLSPAQENYIKAYGQNQIDIYLNGRTNEAIAEKHLKALYAQLGHSEPAITWYDGPETTIKNVRDSVWGSVRDSVRDSVWDSVCDSVRGSVCDSVLDSVWDSVWGSVGDSVWDSVWGSVRGSVWGSVRGFYDAGWTSHYKFFSEEFEKNALDDWCYYLEQVSGGILANDQAHLVRKPVRLVRNSDGRLHYDHDKAIEWADGYGFYYLNGVEFTEKQWRAIVDEAITIEDIAKNTFEFSDDQRVAAIQLLRPDRLLKQVGARLIDTGSRGVELYEVADFLGSGETEYCVKMEHPSIPGRYYIEWCEPTFIREHTKSADEWMAYSRFIPLEDYKNALLA